VRHSLSWWGRGDIDSVAIAPGGVGFVIEVKTSRYDDRHLALVREQAAWLSRFRRRWCRQGIVPVLCWFAPAACIAGMMACSLSRSIASLPSCARRTSPGAWRCSSRRALEIVSARGEDLCGEQAG
jgi:hypothetical protein